MNPTNSDPRTKTLTLEEAFLVMETFIERFGERDQLSPDGLRNLADFISTASSRVNILNPIRPDDPAMWDDWVASARETLPEMWP